MDNIDNIDSLPEEYRLMSLLAEEMRIKNAMDSVKQVSKKHNWSENEKQKMIDNTSKLLDLNNWHCEVCKKSFKKAHKNRHLKSKQHNKNI